MSSGTVGAFEVGRCLESVTKCHELPSGTAAGLDDHEPRVFGGLAEQPTRVQEHPKRSPHDPETDVQDPHDNPHHETITREAEEQHSRREARCRPSESDAVGRAAHDAVQNDDLGGLNVSGLFQNICDAESNSSFESFLFREFASVRLIRSHELDDLSTGRTGAKQLSLNRPDAPSDLQDSSVDEPVPRKTLDHRLFDLIETLFSEPLEALSCKPRLEHLLARSGTAAAGHGGHNTNSREAESDGARRIRNRFVSARWLWYPVDQHVELSADQILILVADHQEALAVARDIVIR